MLKKTTRKRKKYGNFKFYFTMAAIFISLSLFSACAETATERVEEVGGVTAQKIIENPEAYVGKTVTVSGDIEEIYDPRAFNMDSGVSVGELLVIGRTPFDKVPDATGRAMLAGDIATVTGVVKMLTSVEDVEREIGWDLTPQIEMTYKTKPVLIAQSATFRAGTGVKEKPVADDMNSTNINNDPNAKADTTTVKPPVNDSEIVNFSDFERAVDRKSFIGRRVRLEAVNVESVAGDIAFFVGTSPSKRILVVFEQEATPNTPIEGKVDIDKGQRVTIDGVVREMPPLDVAKRQFGHLMTAETLNSLKNEETYIYTDDPKIVSSNK